MRILSYIALFVIFAIGLSFAILNADSVTLDLYVKQFHIALSLLLIAVLIIGVILGVLIMTKPIVSLKAEVSRLKSKLKKCDLRLNQPSSSPAKEH